ncbi:MAG: MFS transporter [Candidatus Thermoplasmatota archaeon]|jgi:MHS family proline/betaine transporter-like MFS transporter|nr:MFS transporter [Candidatus Thermoplasmatota archaeon]MCL5788988.1 MFS transporter [Candidatus Thermoplasmatota archaeon]
MASESMGLRSISGAQRKKIFYGSAMGNLLDWYDYSVYGSLGVVISKEFFPASNILAALLATFLVFALGYFFRPVGGLFFGYFGDKLSRRTTYIVVIIGMGIATGLVGVLPTTLAVGSIAVILLVIMRAVQGFMVGGAPGAGTSLVAESFPNEKRGLFTSLFSAVYPAGILLTDAVILPLAYFAGNNGLLEWGWRIPFLLGFPIMLIALYFVYRIEEPPLYKAISEQRRKSKNPIKEAFAKNPLQMTIIGILGITGSSATMGYVGAVYVLVYMQSVLHISYYTSYLIFLPAITSVVILDAVWGWLSDKIGRLPLFVIGLGLGASIEIPLFYIWGFSAHPLVLPLMILIALVIELPYSLTQGLQALIQSELFPTRVRFTGVAFTWDMGLGIFGGLQTYAATYLLSTLGGVTYTSTGAIATVKYPWIGLLYTTAGCSMGLVVLAAFRKWLPKKGMRIESMDELPPVMNSQASAAKGDGGT